MRQKRIITATVGSVLLGAALLLSQNTSWLTGTSDQKFTTLAGIQPGLGTVMREYGRRIANIYYAGQAGNWGMAAYQLKEMAEIQEVGETTRPARKAALAAFEQSALVPLANDIVSQDLTAFNRDFNNAVAGCNGCHAATGFSYIVYQLPAKPRIPVNLSTGQTFNAADLKAIVAGVLSQPPAISPGAIVNGASFAAAPAAVAPGSIISIFGTNLASSKAQAAATPLPNQLGGTTVTVNGTALPLFYVSPGQINAQLPSDLAAETATAVVTNASGVSQATSFNVASSSVGIFMYANSARAVALNQDGTANGPDNPEARGRVVVLFLTGQGPVDNPVPTGQAAPLSPLARATLPNTATVGGAEANMSFLGLAPTFVGLAQANIEIPAGVATGIDVPVSISVNGQAGNTATISVK